MSMSKEQAAEVARLEAEAQAKAAKHVANMLARPDQLEKVHQLTWERLRERREENLRHSQLATA